MAESHEVAEALENIVQIWNKECGLLTATNSFYEIEMKRAITVSKSNKGSFSHITLNMLTTSLYNFQ